MTRLPVFIILAFLTIMIVPGCSKTGLDEMNVFPNSFFDLKVGKTARVKAENILIKFDSVIGDSRCPEGVLCFAAGEAKCRMIVTENGQNKEVILVQTGSAEGTFPDFAGKYQVSFRLNPYPRAGTQINPGDYIISMRLYK